MSFGIFRIGSNHARMDSAKELARLYIRFYDLNLEEGQDPLELYLKRSEEQHFSSV